MKKRKIKKLVGRLLTQARALGERMHQERAEQLQVLATLGAKEKELAAIHQMNNARGEQVRELSQEGVEKDAEITGLKARAAEREETVAAQTRMIAGLQEERNDLAKKLGTEELTTAKRRDQIISQEGEIADLRKRLEMTQTANTQQHKLLLSQENELSQLRQERDARRIETKQLQDRLTREEDEIWRLRNASRHLGAALEAANETIAKLREGGGS